MEINGEKIVEETMSQGQIFYVSDSEDNDIKIDNQNFGMEKSEGE